MPLPEELLMSRSSFKVKFFNNGIEYNLALGIMQLSLVSVESFL